MNYKIPVSVLVIIFTKDYDVLLLERADRPGFWQSVTGSKKCEQEELIETAKREVEEETGLRLSETELMNWHRSFDFEIFKRWRGRYQPGVFNNTEHVFSVMLDCKVDIVLSDREHLAFCWCSRMEAIDRVFSWTNATALRELPDYHFFHNS